MTTFQSMNDLIKIPPPVTWGFFLALLLNFQQSHAQESFSMNLDECIQYGLDNNLNIQNAKFDEYIAQAQIKEITANGLPQVNISADLQYFLELPTNILPSSFNPDPNGGPLEVKFGTNWQSTAGISANQLLFDGTFFYGLKAAKGYKESTSISTQRSREEAAFAIAKAYYQALITEEQSNLILANINRLEKLLTETSELNKEGFVERIDVDRLEINLNNLKLEKEKIKRLYTVSINLLKFQMGMPVLSTLVLSEDLEDLKDRPVFDLAEGDFNPSNRIEYRLIQKNRELEGLRLKSVQAGYYPSLYAFGSYQFNAQRNEFNFFNRDERWFPISVIGLQLSIPVFDGLRKNAQAQQVRLSLKKIDNQSRLMEESFDLEISNSLVNLKNAYSSLQAYEKNVGLAKRVFDVASIKYREGVGSSLEINDAESQLKQAESSYLSGLLEYLLYQTDYKKARGEFSQYQQN